jgi:hypothetical protein
VVAETGSDTSALSRRSALRLLGGAAVVAAGSAVLTACGAGGGGGGGGGGQAQSGGGGSSAAGGAGATGGGSSGGGIQVAGGSGKQFVKVQGDKVTLTMRGDDIWGQADTFTYLDQKASGDGSWICKVESMDATNEWAKAGIMARKSLDPSSAHVFLCVTIQHGVTLQHRDQDGTSEQGHDPFGDSSQTAPVWLKLEKKGNNWTGYYSLDGKKWDQSVQASTNPIDLGSNYYIGLATTSHDASQHGNAVFSNLQGFKGPFNADAVGTNDQAK